MPSSTKQSAPAFEYPDPDLFEAYVDVAKAAGLAVFTIGPEGIQGQFAPAAEPVSTSVVGFEAKNGGDDDDGELAGPGTTPPLPRNQRNPLLWKNRDGMPPGFRRAPIVTPTPPGNPQ